MDSCIFKALIILQSRTFKNETHKNRRHSLQFYASTSSSRHGSEWSASRSGRLNPDAHRKAVWEGRRAGLDAVVKRKTLPLPGIEPRSYRL